MKFVLVSLALASLSLCACALDGATPVGTEDSELSDPACGALFRAYEECDAREARYDANGKRIEQYVCVDESNAWADCKNPRHAPESALTAVPSEKASPIVPIKEDLR